MQSRQAYIQPVTGNCCRCCCYCAVAAAAPTSCWMQVTWRSTCSLLLMCLCTSGTCSQSCKQQLLWQPTGGCCSTQHLLFHAVTCCAAVLVITATPNRSLNPAHMTAAARTLAQVLLLFCAAVHRAMFAFSTELLKPGAGAHTGPADSSCSSSTSDFVLQPTGRYAHSPGYLGQVAQASGWEVLEMKEAQIRQNAGQPIWGSLCLLQRCDKQ